MKKMMINWANKVTRAYGLESKQAIRAWRIVEALYGREVF